MYVILQKTVDGDKYLVNRNLNKSVWWSKDINEAMKWEFLAAAKAKKETLKFGKNNVVDISTGEIVD